MKWIACLMLMLTASCGTAPASRDALCSITETPRTDLAGALIEDGGPRSKRAGLALIKQIEAGC